MFVSSHGLKGPKLKPCSLCVKKKRKTARKTELNVLWHNTGSPSSLSVVLFSSVFLLVRVTTVDKNNTVVKGRIGRYLFDSVVIMLISCVPEFR